MTLRHLLWPSTNFNWLIGAVGGGYCVRLRTKKTPSMFRRLQPQTLRSSYCAPKQTAVRVRMHAASASFNRRVLCSARFVLIA